MKLLEGKIVIVTGAARGIGEAIALRMAEQGAHIAFSFLSSEERAKALEEKLRSFGVKAKGYKSNAGSYEDCEKFVSQVLEEHGTVDVCINNAGISKDSLLLRLNPAQWDEVMETNLKSVFNMTKQVIRPMMKAKKGSIINMSSIIGIRGNAGQSSYAASKAGIIGFTKSVAHELGSRNIRCNAIAPGFVETDMTHYLQDEESAKSFLAKIPLNRFGSAAEIADTTLFLASDMSSYITGQVISVCGGLNI
ncbi:MAG TPA: 3-oxoacyl-[acyl-carrier-protein] reductase [Chitinophagaceae bacterium]|jgi:3-oxoacyl-[acyl-carrier protein] reductase|nr:3-oxoacyl-[acyl-carrier-protein] reductase [Chitinophagaceae bacterium]